METGKYYTKKGISSCNIIAVYMSVLVYMSHVSVGSISVLVLQLNPEKDFTRKCFY